MVVMPDAVIDKTVDGIIGSAFGAAGQRCMAGSVVVTVGEAHDKLMPALTRGDRGAARRRRHRRGRRRRPGRLVRGARPRPRLDRPRRDGRRDARRRRARARRRPDPAARSSARRSSTTSRPTWRSRSEEIFGPVLSVVHADSLDDAIDDHQPQPLRQRHVDLHRVRRGGAPLPPRGRGRHDRRQHRRRRAGRLLPVLRLEGLVPRRPARARARRRRVLHAQEDRHEPLVLERPGHGAYFVEQ